MKTEAMIYNSMGLRFTYDSMGGKTAVGWAIEVGQITWFFLFLSATVESTSIYLTWDLVLL